LSVQVDTKLDLAVAPRRRGDDQRARILEIVAASPGLPVGALLEGTQLGWGTLYHHLAKLAKSRSVQVVRVGRRRLVYPMREGGVVEMAPGDALLRGQTVRRIALAIEATPGRGIAEIAAQVEQSPRVTYYHVRRLIEAGIVASSAAKRHRDLAPTPRLREILGRQAGNGSDLVERAEQSPVPEAVK
jgi:DNA-binding transcriptional ArsR family regulator